MPKVSIIVPVYNASEKIARCVESLRNQTLLDIEVILIDDGSSDDSFSVCKKMAETDSRVFVYHQENAGVSAARNTGIEKATGDWLMFVDADDWIALNTVHDMLEKVVTHGADVGVYSFLNEFSDSCFPLAIDNGTFSPAEIITGYRPGKNYDAILCSVCNKIYRREIIDANRIRFETGIKFGEDFIFNSYVLSRAQLITTTDQLLYHYDCTSEDSGVKKLYADYDTFIYAMDQAVCSLLDSVSIDPAHREAFRESFIGARWQYAIGVCLNSSKTKEEQGELICKWVNAMPTEMREWKILSGGKTGQLLDLWETGTPFQSQVCNRIREIAAAQKKRAYVCKIKRVIKRVFGKP